VKWKGKREKKERMEKNNKKAKEKSKLETNNMIEKDKRWPAEEKKTNKPPR
jgi:hypothetical protein